MFLHVVTGLRALGTERLKIIQIGMARPHSYQCLVGGLVLRFVDGTTYFIPKPYRWPGIEVVEDICEIFRFWILKRFGKF